MPVREWDAVTVMITPDLRGIMRRAAEREVRKYEVAWVVTGREILEVEVDQRDTQDRVVGDADRIERDVETVSLVDYFAEVVVGGLLVEGVDLGRRPIRQR